MSDRRLYLEGRPLTLDSRCLVGSGGEADVYRLDESTAVKLFKTPDHPDLAGRPDLQASARDRISEHQRKLRAFPRGLPSRVCAPRALVIDSNGSVAGYSMQLVSGSEPLLRYGDPAFRRRGISNAAICRLFLELHSMLVSLHDRGVLAADLNDLNVLVRGHEPFLIDCDSFEFGEFRCRVYTDRFIDPSICSVGANGIAPSERRSAETDWYAFSVLLVRCLLLVDPYGGVYAPSASNGARVAPHLRPLRGLSIFRDGVRYPKQAIPIASLQLDLHRYLGQVFSEGLRGRFPTGLLDPAQWRICRTCGLEHGRPSCPSCEPGAGPHLVTRCIGKADCRTIFEAPGAILDAAHINGRLYWCFFDGEGTLRREDGGGVECGAARPLAARVSPRKTLLQLPDRVRIVSEAHAPRQLACDRPSLAAPFAVCGDDIFFLSGGFLVRAAEPFDERVGRVLEGQTSIWAGQSLGFGFSTAGSLSRAFVFRPRSRLLSEIPFDAPPGRILSIATAFADARIWVRLTIREKPADRSIIYVLDASGHCLSSLSADDPGGEWLAEAGGMLAVGESLFVSTDRGVLRIRHDGGAIRLDREFPSTEPFVSRESRLFPAPEGLYVIGERKIDLVRV